MQPNNKTKSSDFLPNKPAMDGLARTKPQEKASEPIAESNTKPDAEQTNIAEKPAFEPPKQSAHVIDLKSNETTSNSLNNESPNPATSENANHNSDIQIPQSSENDPTITDKEEPHATNKKSNKTKWALIILAFVVLLIVAIAGGILVANASNSTVQTINSSIGM